MTPEEIKALLKQQHDLQEKLLAIVEKRGVNDGKPNKDVIEKETMKRQTDDLINSMVERGLIPKEQPKKMIFGGEAEIKGNERRVALGEWLLMAKASHPDLASDYVKTVMSEGTNEQGGYTVPPDFEKKIIGDIYDKSTIIPKCTPYPQVGFTKNIPKWLTGITISWIDENGVKTITKPTLEQLQSILKKIVAGPIAFTDEYLADDQSSPGIVFSVNSMVSKAFMVEIERVILIGNTGGGDPFNGIAFSAAVNNVPQAGANFSYTDVVGIWNNANVLEIHRENPEWYLNRNALGLLMNLLDLNNKPLWNLGLAGNVPPSILGDPYFISSQIPSNYGAGSDETRIIFGDYRYVLLGEKKGKGGITVAVSNSAVDATGGSGVNQNAFMQDETWYRFVKRQGILVGIAEAFSVGTGII